MAWMWIVGIFLICGGGAWIAETLRDGRQNRHERRLEELRIRERQLRRAEERERPPEPVCGCGHHLAMHDRDGHCHEVVRRPTGWDADREPLGYEPADCLCRQYVGPQPLSRIFAEDLTDHEPLDLRKPNDGARALSDGRDPEGPAGEDRRPGRGDA
ncbi:hypothetical protein, partial [Streptomyces alkaliphilus]|uniref:hypothetical protein n=1 Tax=Streptomyces alkaliphilus TaxID=1472722 RepID=UPI0027BB120F